MKISPSFFTLLWFISPFISLKITVFGVFVGDLDSFLSWIFLFGGSGTLFGR